jgi:hypothetical protein
MPIVRIVDVEVRPERNPFPCEDRFIAFHASCLEFSGGFAVPAIPQVAVGFVINAFC